MKEIQLLKIRIKYIGKNGFHGNLCQFLLFGIQSIKQRLKMVMLQVFFGELQHLHM